MWQLRSSILDYVSRAERPTNPVKITGKLNSVSWDKNSKCMKVLSRTLIAPFILFRLSAKSDAVINSPWRKL